MSSPLSRALFRFSRTRAGGAVTRWAFARATRLMPVERLFETDTVIAFRHPSPTHQVHVLIVPKKAIKSLADIDHSDSRILTDVFRVAARLVKDLALEEMGYSLVVNGGPRQDVPQIHFHLQAGEELGAPSP